MEMIPYIDKSQALDTYTSAPIYEAITLETVIGAWLHQKFGLSKSERTQATYTGIITSFRSWLNRQGYDLTWLGNVEDIEEKLTTLIQAFAFQPLREGQVQVSTATRNKRLAILSSFYTFAIQRHPRMFPFRNPVTLLERSKVQKYGKAKALEIGAVADGLATIDDNTLEGKRDKALLLILLQTGRRVAEIASLTWGNVEIARRKQVVTLHFPRTKGDKSMSDTLPADISGFLLTWLESWYGKDYALTLDNNAPIWVILAEHHTVKQADGTYVSDYGKPLKYQSIAGSVKHYLGTTKVHRTRHTFSKLYLQSGGSVKELQGRLAMPT